MVGQLGNVCGGGYFEFAILASGEGGGGVVVVISDYCRRDGGFGGSGGGGWWGRSGRVAGSPPGRLVTVMSSYDISLGYPAYGPSSLEGNAIHELFAKSNPKASGSQRPNLA